MHRAPHGEEPMGIADSPLRPRPFPDRHPQRVGVRLVHRLSVRSAPLKSVVDVRIDQLPQGSFIKHLGIDVGECLGQGCDRFRRVMGIWCEYRGFHLIPDKSTPDYLGKIIISKFILTYEMIVLPILELRVCANTLNTHNRFEVSQTLDAVANPCSPVRGVDVTLFFVGEIETSSRRPTNALVDDPTRGYPVLFPY